MFLIKDRNILEYIVFLKYKVHYDLLLLGCYLFLERESLLYRVIIHNMYEI